MSKSNPQEPLVTVCLPAYNAEKYIDQAINSILHQTYTNWELIVIDDASSDKTHTISKEIAKNDSRIRIIRNTQNLGVVKTRNKLFSLASKETEYYAIFDADDISHPKRIQKQVAYLERHPNVGLVGSNIRLVDEEGQVLGRREYPTRDQEIQSTMLIFDPLAQPSVMIRKHVVDELNGYDENYERCQDYDLWWRVSKKYKVANLKEELVDYRIHPMQGKTTALKKTIRNTLRIKRNHLTIKQWIRPTVTFRYLAESILLCMPKKTVLWMTKKYLGI